MTFAEFKNWIKRRSGNRTDIDNEILLSLNLALLDLSSLLKIIDEKGNDKNVVLDLPELEERRSSPILEVLIDSVGTVAVTQNSPTVTGTGTLWGHRVRQFDLFTTDGGVTRYQVAATSGDTQLTLATNYTQATASAIGYRIDGFSDIVTLPADLVFLLAVFLRSKNRRLEKTEETWIVDQGFVARGEPEKFARLGPSILLYPAPSQAFTMRIRLRRTPPLFVTTSPGDSTTIINLRWHEIIADLASAKLFGLLEEYDKSEEVYRKMVYPSILRRVGIVEAERPSEPVMGIRPHADWIA